MSDNLFKSLDKIKEASQKYRQRTSFKIGETTLVLETIDSNEEAFIQNWALSLSGEKKSQKGFFAYYKLGILALAIKKVGDEDLSDYSPDDLIETGEVLDNGVKVKVSRFKALYDTLCSLDAEVLDNIFATYMTMAQISQEQIEGDVEQEKLGVPPKELKTIRRTLQIMQEDASGYTIQDPLDAMVEDQRDDRPEQSE
jgi:hypothetical protein